MAVSGHEIDVLYRRHAGAVFRRAQQLLKRDDEAHEVVQELFLSLLERPSQTHGAMSMAAWLYGATTHACFNRLRNHKNRSRLLNERLVPREIDERLTPDQATLLRDTLHMLPPPLGEVAVYAFLDGLSHEEIGKLVGCSRSHVANLIERIFTWARAQEAPCDSP